MAAKGSQQELDGMPPSTPILRINGDDFIDPAEARKLKVDDTVSVVIEAVVKRVGEEHVGKGGKRKFVQLYATSIELT